MKEDTKWRLRDSEGKEYIIIDSEKVDLQEELNKTIVKQMQEIERLNNKVEELMELYTTERHCKDDYKAIIKEVREYITSYESISIMQGLMNEYSNYDLDIKTMNEMIRRYMVVHDKLIEILDKGD